MTAQDKSHVREDLAGYRVTLAAIKRDYLLCHDLADEWQIKATAAMVAGDSDAEEFGQASFMFWRNCEREGFEQHATLLACIRVLEKSLTT